jgi:uncharacterized cupredoxin-like copper-binding protein
MKMKLIAGGALVLIAAGVLGYFLVYRKTASPSPTATPTPTPELTGEVDQEISITAKEYGLEPAEVRIKAGEWVRVTLKNEGSVQHDWALEKMPSIRIGLVKPGETGAVEFTIGTKGEYTFYCSVPGHQELGMEGKLIVE